MVYIISLNMILSNRKGLNHNRVYLLLIGRQSHLRHNVAQHLIDWGKDGKQTGLCDVPTVESSAEGGLQVDVQNLQGGGRRAPGGAQQSALPSITSDDTASDGLTIHYQHDKYISVYWYIPVATLPSTHSLEAQL
jgi:hypothetical protein